MTVPHWWKDAETDIDLLLVGFSERLRKRLSIRPEKIIESKNPFLFCTRAVEGPEAYARMLIDAFLTSSEETIFGTVLEQIAIAICCRARSGWKSTTENIDLEYDSGEIRTIVQIKSGTKWGNSSQRKKLEQSFKTSQRILRQGKSGQVVRCVEGCCYGKSGTKDKGTYFTIVGRDFWYEISGWNGTASAVLQTLEKYARNGFHEDRKNAVREMVSYLKDRGAIEGDNLIWDKILSLVMDRAARFAKDENTCTSK